MRRVEKGSGGGKLCPTTVWHRSSRTSLMDDVDLPRVVATPAAEVAAASCIPKNTFSASSDGCSLSDGLLQTLHSESPHWPTLSPEEYMSHGFRWAAALSVSGDWAALERSSWAQLMVPGSIVLQAGEDYGLLVVKSSPFGFLGMRVSLFSIKDGPVCLGWPKADENMCEVRLVDDPDLWRCVSSTCIGSGHPEFDAQARLKGFQVMGAGNSKKLIRYACEQGLRGITTTILRQMYAALEVPCVRGQRPRREAEFLTAIVSHVLGGDGTMVKAACDKHFEEEPLPAGVGDTPMLDKGALELVLEEIADDALADEVMKFKERVERQRARAAAGSEKVAGVLGQRPSARTAYRPALPWVAGRGLSQPGAKRLAPESFSVAKDLVRHFRWVVRHSQSSWSVSKTFGKGATEEQDNTALLFCLRAAWKHRSDLTGMQDCPHQLDGALFG